jgi:predicted ferric reductase
MATHAYPRTTPGGARVRPQPQPRVRSGHVLALGVANALIIAGLWLWHGGLGELTTFAGVETAIGQLTALFGTYLALIQLLLMSRAPLLDRLFGRDQLTMAHRWIGFGTVWLLVAHGLFTTLGFAMADDASPVGEFWMLITTWDFVLMATVSLGLFIAVAVTSVRLARKRISYESWYGIHLYAYLAVALGFAHQLVVGTDFIDDPLARGYWVGLYVVVIGCLLAFRFGAPIVLNVRHRFRVANVLSEGPGVVSVYLTGRDLDRLDVRAGQYLVVRFLTAGWWRAHPYSISAEPNGRWLRFTVKALGDDSARLDRLAVGTRVIVEGPYGNLTADRRTARDVLLVAGGIGITPLRAILEEVAATARVTLLYRARTAADLVFRHEIETLAEGRPIVVRYLIGPRSAFASDPLGLAAISAMVPDVAGREVYLCGPAAMMSATQAVVEGLGVPASRIHQERFDD